MTEVKLYLTATICGTRYLIVLWTAACVALAYILGRHRSRRDCQ